MRRSESSQDTKSGAAGRIISSMGSPDSNEGPGMERTAHKKVK